MALSYEQAQKILSAGVEKATAIGSPSSIAIVDGGQDGALLASLEISSGKAYTACSKKMATQDIGPLTQPGGPLFGLENTHQRTLISFGGGRPIEVGGEVVGAVGVAGGSTDQDDEIAAAAAAAVGS